MSVNPLNAMAMVGMSHRYTVRLDGPTLNMGAWYKVTGLSVSWQQIEHRVGEYGNRVWLYPGTTKYEPITLSRAVGADSQAVQTWLAQTSKNPQPQSGAIQLVDFSGNPIVTWHLNEFFPIAWSIESFDAAGGKPAIETLKLAHTGFLADHLNSQSPA
ncbi:MAG TPA: phage tail protein [Actinocrinis sp.]|uniref:phage tail protein n=1 Tax=Actinocrinis sp. TaxID=1920516 RepID=UPI002DDCC6AF|nr:phage tail protein [Actinocrinis sp.]HEV2344686.1 phage tail protein [Actinocrinis sp.]